ncbi:MAG: adenine nucleotide alpha hydrolase [Proteobacteria bacterium]|nr:adenine nucleotide alpha hydrolase [Pseudomonadota bacterium]NDC25929.1 adenine nucleotide alpha hydrolase [Pseudomonadota bacterium]NDD03868.1 adenine nucleotide alpha hydrolase [Pseudomonadota bacterium]
MNTGKSKAALFWSSGKDACLALQRLKTHSDLDVVQLISTIQSPSKRVNFHGTSESLLQAQAQSLRLPLTLVALPDNCTNQQYESLVIQALSGFQKQQINHLVFGDLFLNDIRQYRENFLERLGYSLCFPLWQNSTALVAQEIIESGLQCIVSAVDPNQLDPRCLGASFDQSFLKSLPPGVDPCGENGEFHTFVWNSPLFHDALVIKAGPPQFGPFNQWLDLKLGH